MYKTSKVKFLAQEPRKFTLEELKQYDGKGGRPAYIAHKGKVYEVTDSAFWLEGDHLGAHQAGKDLTEEIELAPHGEETVARMKLVGVIA